MFMLIICMLNLKKGRTMKTVIFISMLIAFSINSEPSDLEKINILNDSIQFRKKMALAFQLRKMDEIRHYLDQDFVYIDDVFNPRSDGNNHTDLKGIQETIPWGKISKVFLEFDHSEIYLNKKGQILILQKNKALNKNGGLINLSLFRDNKYKWKISRILIFQEIN